MLVVYCLQNLAIKTNRYILIFFVKIVIAIMRQLRLAMIVLADHNKSLYGKDLRCVASLTTSLRSLNHLASLDRFFFIRYFDKIRHANMNGSISTEDFEMKDHIASQLIMKLASAIRESGLSEEKLFNQSTAMYVLDRDVCRSQARHFCFSGLTEETTSIFNGKPIRTPPSVRASGGALRNSLYIELVMGCTQAASK